MSLLFFSAPRENVGANCDEPAELLSLAHKFIIAQPFFLFLVRTWATREREAWA